MIALFILLGLVIFFLSFLIPAVGFLVVILYIALVVMYYKKKNSNMRQLGIPKDAKKILHGTNDSFPFLNRKLYFYNEGNKIDLWDTKAKKKIEVAKDDITSFYMMGDKITNTTVSGGGPSIGGAVVGGALFGVAGALIGGRKKVKTSTQTVDTRKAVLKFKDGSEDKGLIFLKPDLIWESLCYMCPEKRLGM